ncbi:MAG: hypothetical protein AAF772_19230, partial [Acidobacteriota bacterium]
MSSTPTVIQHVAVAGATGNAGREIVQQLLARAATAMLRPFHEDAWQLADFFVGKIAYARRVLRDDASLPAVGTLRLIDDFRARL